MSKVIFVFPIWCFYLKYLVYSYLHFFFFKQEFMCKSTLPASPNLCVLRKQNAPFKKERHSFIV